MCVIEICAVINGSLLGRRSTKYFGSPGIEVRIEVDHADRPVCFVDRAEEREGDGVITAKGDDTREGFALLRRANFLCVGHRFAHE